MPVKKKKLKMLDSLNIQLIERRIGYTFKNKDLLVRAFTHPSFVNENKNAVDYQRLEYLGDSIIGFLCAEDTFLNSSSNEGKMTKARQDKVSKRPLASDMDALGVFAFVRCGKGFASSAGSKDKVKSDVIEALAAAIYLDSGRNMDAARKFYLQKIISLAPEKDYKSELNELPGEYKYATDSIGSQTEPQFFSKVMFGEKVCGEGYGKNVKAAEQNAAKDALSRLNRDK